MNLVDPHAHTGPKVLIQPHHDVERCAMRCAWKLKMQFSVDGTCETTSAAPPSYYISYHRSLGDKP